MNKIKDISIDEVFDNENAMVSVIKIETPKVIISGSQLDADISLSAMGLYVYLKYAEWIDTTQFEQLLNKFNHNLVIKCLNELKDAKLVKWEDNGNVSVLE